MDRADIQSDQRFIDVKIDEVGPLASSSILRACFHSRLDLLSVKYTHLKQKNWGSCTTLHSSGIEVIQPRSLSTTMLKVVLNDRGWMTISYQNSEHYCGIVKLIVTLIVVFSHLPPLVVFTERNWFLDPHHNKKHVVVWCIHEMAPMNNSM